MTQRSGPSTDSGAPRYLVVEGPIGVGKTSLARRLAESLGGELVLEEPEENPFLERFYHDPRNAALHTQLFFLLQRARKVQAMRQADLFSPVRVSDFLLEKDQLFARLTLDNDELVLYQQLYERLAIDAAQPDLVVYLQAPVESLLERIARRGIPYEQGMPRDYLARLCEAYARFFHFYDAGPLLIVNTARFNPSGNDEHFAALLERVRRIRSGRHFFNPQVTADRP